MSFAEEILVYYLISLAQSVESALLVRFPKQDLRLSVHLQPTVPALW
jgi:hypothetical protein